MSDIIITPSDPIDVVISNEFNTIEVTNDVNEIVISKRGTQGIQGDKGDKGDAGEGVPVGGTSGQVLAKVDGTDYHTQWVDDNNTLSWIDVAGDIQYNGVETIIASGEVLQGDYKGGLIYRFISSAENANGYRVEDSFYSDFDGTNLTNLIVQRGV